MANVSSYVVAHCAASVFPVEKRRTEETLETGDRMNCCSSESATHGSFFSLASSLCQC